MIKDVSFNKVGISKWLRVFSDEKDSRDREVSLILYLQLQFKHLIYLLLSSPVKKGSAESGDSSVAPITKRIAELEAAEGTPSRGKRVRSTLTGKSCKH